MFNQFKKTIFVAVSVLLVCSVGSLQAERSGATIAQFTAYPIGLLEAVTPKVMLTMTKDHQLHYKAYNDYIDLIGKNSAGEYDVSVPLDSEPETGYVLQFQYYGYFNSTICYNYSQADGRFVPFSIQDDDGYCAPGTSWNGNFLNWLTMTRMDVMRKVFYGGMRSTDTAGLTILERAYLPPDAHSFAKYYNGDDLPQLTPFRPGVDYIVADPADPRRQGITFCNVTPDNTAAGAASELSTAAPKLHIAQGNYSLWGASERFQCIWRNGNEGSKSDAFPTFGRNGNVDPDPNDGQVETLSGLFAYSENPYNPSPDGALRQALTVRVEVCSGVDIRRECRLYGTSKKPVGLLQDYTGRIEFGLMTGSYSKNLSGGILRTNPRNFIVEINPTNGTFNDIPGIVKNMNALRMFGYWYGNGTYLGDGCDFQQTDVTEGTCRSWGNPVSEMFLETIRYFAGEASPTAAYDTDDSSVLAGLSTEAWVRPINDENFCVSMNTVVINASVTSYDTDALDNFQTDVYTSPLRGASTLDAIVDLVGTDENIGTATNQALVGLSQGGGAGSVNELCTAKVGNLSGLIGICPEGPSVAGGYDIAGLAYYANVTDLYPQYDNDQTVTTYAVALTPTVPNIEIDVNNDNINDVVILPAYQLVLPSGGIGAGALVDFRIIEKTDDYGKYYVSWEDSEQGGDYDQDVWGLLEYRVTQSGGQYQVAVTTDVIAQSTANPQGFGYVISGTTQDGFHAHSGIFGYNFVETSYTGLNDCSGGCQPEDPPTTNIYTVGNSVAKLPPQPLFLAAKYGGFNDEEEGLSPNDKTINNATEWDRITNNTGDLGSDNIPDNYFFVTDPSKFEERLSRVFNRILNNLGSGSAPAVVSNGTQSIGATYQAVYRPQTGSGSADEIATWTGDINAFWIDDQGLLREDSNRNATLDDYATDRVIVFERPTDSSVVVGANNEETRVKVYAAPPAGDETDFESFDPDTSPSTLVDYGQVKPIWNAADWLSQITDADILRHRSYNSNAKQRHIITWIDGGETRLPNGRLQNTSVYSEIFPFLPSSFVGDNASWFDMTDTARGVSPAEQTAADNLVNFIRGYEDPNVGFRNRTAEIEINGEPPRERKLILGDIVTSSPAAIGGPAGAYDSLYNDQSYFDFKLKYRNRRNMVYTGSNGGMLHAFNAGFYRAASRSYTTNGFTGTETQFDLGAEMWAYVPGNLLPQLRFLSSPEYTHVFYVDAQPRVLDARIFPPSPTHPGGWGTIMIAGMRMGGGEIVVDTNANGINNGFDNVAVGSAYIVMDITDPEQPPKVLTEINRGNRRTLSNPTGLFFASFGDSSNSKWYIAFADGPDDISNGTSTQNAQLVIVDINNTDDIHVERVIDLGQTEAFGGDVTAVDWDIDYRTDAIYVGTSEVQFATNGSTTQEGRLIRVNVNGDANVNNWTVTKLLETPRSLLVEPIPAFDPDGNEWVFTGSGRFIASFDKGFSNQNRLYGIIDRATGSNTRNPGNINEEALLNVSLSQVGEDADGVTLIRGVDGVNTGGSEEDRQEAIRAAQTRGGWRRTLRTFPNNRPSEGQSLNSLLFENVLFVPVSRSGDNACTGPRSRLFALDYRTGIAAGVSGFRTGDSQLNTIFNPEFGEINGFVSPPAVFIDRDGQSSVIVGIGPIIVSESIDAAPIRRGELSWRELIQ